MDQHTGIQLTENVKVLSHITEHLMKGKHVKKAFFVRKRRWKYRNNKTSFHWKQRAAAEAGLETWGRGGKQRIRVDRVNASHVRGTTESQVRHK